MADVWLVKEGSEPTRGEGIELSLPDCIKNLGLAETGFLCGPGSTPRFGAAQPTQVVRGHQHVVVEVGEAEARTHRWKPGFYRAAISAKDASKVLKSS
jgi:hypothetical protein